MTAFAELKLLREEIALLGPRHPSRRFPPDLKARVLDWVSGQRAIGVRPMSISESLGIPWESIGKWLRNREPTPEMKAVAEVATASDEQLRPVRVVERASRPPRMNARPGSGAVILRTPQGFAVEGLDLEGVVALLRRLR
jgi:hypothetical protein